jgi:hypothetical protein
MCGLLGRVVRKGSNFDPVLCDLSPPVSPGRKAVSQYTFRGIGSDHSAIRCCRTSTVLYN